MRWKKIAGLVAAFCTVFVLAGCSGFLSDGVVVDHEKLPSVSKLMTEMSAAQKSQKNVHMKMNMGMTMDSKTVFGTGVDGDMVVSPVQMLASYSMTMADKTEKHKMYMDGSSILIDKNGTWTDATATMKAMGVDMSQYTSQVNGSSTTAQMSGLEKYATVKQAGDQYVIEAKLTGAQAQALIKDGGTGLSGQASRSASAISNIDVIYKVDTETKLPTAVGMKMTGKSDGHSVGITTTMQFSRWGDVTVTKPDTTK